MCNTVHEDWEKIPEEGTGYKLCTTKRCAKRLGFEVGPNEGIAWITMTKYRVSEDGWIKWVADSEDGFCFFLTPPDDKAYQTDSGTQVLRKIEYRKGLGKGFDEALEGQEFAICKEFRFVD